MREGIPIPGSAKARLIESTLHHVERVGFEAMSVADVATKAGVTTGSLYHHFGSKLGLYLVVRGDMERRITDRMEGAAASVSADGSTSGVRAALMVAFDAAVRFDACRLLGEPLPAGATDSIEATLRPMLPSTLGDAAPVLVAALRAALLCVADGSTAESARAGLAFVVHE
ncbi:TetR/AcrR family transcriptional regulator [Phytoactinopolyspora limicola]|uniref:TetR/AcrR family transcriptional regulator n=1 Tax=Phytoactinopolyspora limicola TaxID=2715536 RepID=UPI001408E8A7|nr:TetR/AcrR family transcriptional regulator [Phytoactinopolyspora limicola]